MFHTNEGRRVASDLVRLQEEERVSLAGELHDGVAQDVASLWVLLQCGDSEGTLRTCRELSERLQALFQRYQSQRGHELRQRLVEELEELRTPIFELQNILHSGKALPHQLRCRCQAITLQLLHDLRAKLSEWRNPVLHGCPLSKAWPELGRLDPALDEACQPTALLCYRVVQECRYHLGSELNSLDLQVEGQWLRANITVQETADQERLLACARRCRLVGGSFVIVRLFQQASVQFELPLRGLL